MSEQRSLNMVRDLVGLLLDIENAYEAVRLNVEVIGTAQYMIGTDQGSINSALHIAYLCEKDIEAELTGMKAAIDKLKQGLKQPPESPLPPPVNPPIA
jgi:hypothetical protein